MNQIKSVTPQEIEQIFANIEDIISINEPFFRDLKQRQLKATVVEQIGDILSKYVNIYYLFIKMIHLINLKQFHF